MSESVLEMNPWFEENRRQAQTIYELRAENAPMREALELVQRCMRTGKIKDQSISPRPKPGDVEPKVTTLSTIIHAALTRTKSEHDAEKQAK